MLSGEQLRIVGYRAGGEEFYGEYLCRDCGEKEGLDAEHAVSEYEMGESAYGGEGIWCCQCSFEIVAESCSECGAEGVRFYMNTSGDRRFCYQCQLQEGLNGQERWLERGVVDYRLPRFALGQVHKRPRHFLMGFGGGRHGR